MTRMVALLRGINLGARNRVPMPALRELLAEHRYQDVATVVQSGNIVLSTAVGADRLAADLQGLIAQRFGVDTPVVVRTAAQLAAVVQANPLPQAAADPKRFQVSFLSEPCPADTADALAAADIAPEQVAIRGAEVYAWHVAGMQKSPLARMLTDKRLGVTATARNWNTVLKLRELSGG